MEAYVERMVDEFNQLEERASKLNIKFVYHNFRSSSETA